jgi:hypothetical protein
MRTPPHPVELSPLAAWNLAAWRRIQAELNDDGSLDAQRAITDAVWFERCAQFICENHADALSVDAPGLSGKDRLAIRPPQSLQGAAQ